MDKTKDYKIKGDIKVNKDNGIVVCTDCGKKVSVLNDFGSWRFYCECGTQSVYYGKDKNPDNFRQCDVLWEKKVVNKKQIYLGTGFRLQKRVKK